MMANVRGGGGDSNQHAAAAANQAASWCACALQILYNAPAATALSSDVYDVFRMHFIRFLRLGSMMLATVERAVEKNKTVEGKYVWPFVTLAVLSSKNCDGDIVRDAVGKLATHVRKLSREDVASLVKMLDGHARRDLMEVCVARPGGLLTKTLPALMAAWPACRGSALNLAAAGLLHGSFATWIDVLELVGKCWRESYGALSAEEQQSVMTVVRKLPELASSRDMRSVSRVARAVTRIAVVSSPCEAALVETARELMTARGAAPACGMFIASQLLCCGGGGHDDAHFGDATALLEAGVSHRDDFIKCVAFELVAGIVDDEPRGADITAWSRTIVSAAASTAASAMDGLSMTMNELGQQRVTTPRLLAALPGAVRLVFVDMRSDPEKHASLLRELLTAVARVEDLTSAHLENNRGSFLAFKSLLEIMLDEAVRFPGTMKLRSAASASHPVELESRVIEDVDPAVMNVSPVNLVEAHRRLVSILEDGSVASESLGPLCRMRLRGCAKLLDIASRTSYFAAEHMPWWTCGTWLKHRMHIMDVAVRCLKDLSSASNHFFEDDVESAVRDCATHAMTSWRAWRASSWMKNLASDDENSYAEVPRALELLRECMTVTSAHGDLDKVHKLIVQVTAEDERVKASMAVAKRTNAVSTKLLNAAGRAARHSPVCGITAMFGDAFHNQVFDTAADDDIAAVTLNVMRALIHMSGAEASADAGFVVDASMNVMRDVLFDAHVMKSAHAVNTMQLLVEHYKRVDTLPERVTSLAHILFEAAPHVAEGNLLDALRVLLTHMETDLAVLSKSNDARASEDGVLSDASTALHKALDAVNVYFASENAVPEGMPAFAVLALRAARHCLDVIHAMPPDSDELAAVITAGAKLSRSVEFIMRNQIAPSHVQRALEPWRRELFSHSARMAESCSFNARGRARHRVRGLSGFLSAKGDEYLEELLQLQALMASKVDWVDEWPTPAPEPAVSAAEVKPSGVDLLGELANTASALETTWRRQSAPEAQRATPKTKRKRDRNPFVEALKAAEGGKGGTSKEYDDLEDFIVCKPGRNYKRLLGL